MAKTVRRDVITRYRLDSKEALAELRAISKTSGQAAKSLDRLERSSAQTSKSMGLIGRQLSMAGKAIQGLVIYKLVGQFREVADAATDTIARIESLAGSFDGVGTKVEKGKLIFEDLKRIATRLGIDVSELAAGYVKLGVAVPTAEHEELTMAMETMAQVLATTGASAQQVNAVLLQMSQALASGALQGDEFRSVYENAPVLLQAWQKAAGLTGQSLRDLSSSASLTTESFMELLPEIKRIAGEMIGSSEVPLTFGRALQNLRTEIISLFAEFRSQTGESPFQVLANGIQAAATGVSKLDGLIAGLSNTLTALVSVIADVYDGLVSWITPINDIAIAFGAAEEGAGSLSDFVGYVFTVVLPVQITTFGATINAFIEGTRTAFEILWERILGAVKRFVADARVVFERFVVWIKEMFYGVGQDAGQFLVDGLNSAIRTANKFLPDMLAFDELTFTRLPADVDTTKLKEAEALAKRINQETETNVAFAKDRLNVLLEENQAKIQGLQISLDDARLAKKTSAEAELGKRKFEDIAEATNKAGAGAGKLAKETAKARTEASKLKIDWSGIDFTANAQKGLAKTNKTLQREVSRLAQDLENIGLNVVITSTYRSGNPRSKHFTGNAIDLVVNDWKQATDYWNANAHKYALKFPVFDERPGNQAGTTYGTGPHWHAVLDQMKLKAVEAQAALGEIETVGPSLNDVINRLEQLRAPYEQLKASVDPAYAAQMEFNRSLKELDKALLVGAISLEEYDEGIQILNERMQKESVEAVNEFQDALETGLGNALGDFLRSGLQDAEKFADDFKNVILDMVADLAKRLLQNTLVVPIVAAVTGGGAAGAAADVVGGGGGGGGLLGGGGGGGGFGNLLKSFGQLGPNLGAGLGKVFQSLGFQNSFTGGMVDALSMTPTWGFGIGTALGGFLGKAMGGDAMISGITAGIGSAAGSALAGGISSAIGASLGSVVPVVGTILGGLVGGAIGSLFGGEKKLKPTANLAVINGQIVSGGTRDMAPDQINAMNTAIVEMNTVINDLRKAMEAATGQAVELTTKVPSYNVAPEALENNLSALFNRILNDLGQSLGDTFDMLFAQASGDIDQFVQSVQILGGVLKGVAETGQETGHFFDEMMKVAVHLGGAQGAAQAVQFAGALYDISNAITPGSIKSLEDASFLMLQIGLEHAPAMIEALGGFLNLRQALMTQEEKNAQIMSAAYSAFGEFGEEWGHALVMMSAPELKTYIDSLDLNNEQHKRAAEIFGKNSAVLAAYIELIQEHDEVVVEETTNVQLLIRELELLGRSEEALALTRETELSSLNDLDQEVQRRIYALEDEAAAAETTARSIQGYVDALLSVQRMLDQTRQGIEEWGLGEQKIYELRKAEADRLMDALGEMTDAKMIEDTVSEINRLIGEGWGILEDSQKDAMKKQFLKYLDEVEELANERLAVGLAPMLPEADVSLEGSLRDFSEVVANLDGSLAASSEGFEHSSAEMRAAAREMAAAAAQMSAAARNIPGTLTVSVRGSEVS